MKYRSPDSRIVGFVGATATMIIFGVSRPPPRPRRLLLRLSAALSLLPPAPAAPRPTSMPIKNLPFGNFTREGSGLEIVGPGPLRNVSSSSLEKEALKSVLGRWTPRRPLPLPAMTIVPKLEIPFSLIPPKFHGARLVRHRENCERRFILFSGAPLSRRRNRRMFRTRRLPATGSVSGYAAWFLARYG